jgi:hypothetical protein
MPAGKMRGQAIEKRRRSHRGAQQRDILPVAVVVVDGGVTRIAIADLAGRMCVRVPNRLAPCHPRRLPSIRYGEVATPQRKSSAMPLRAAAVHGPRSASVTGCEGAGSVGSPAGRSPRTKACGGPAPVAVRSGVCGGIGALHGWSGAVAGRHGAGGSATRVLDSAGWARAIFPGPRSQRRITGRRRVRTRGAIRRARFADR